MRAKKRKVTKGTYDVEVDGKEYQIEGKRAEKRRVVSRSSSQRLGDEGMACIKIQGQEEDDQEGVGEEKSSEQVHQIKILRK